MFNWSDIRLEELRKYWGEGFSCSEIATRLGGNVTRNAVIGKLHRLGLKRADKPISKLPALACSPGFRYDGSGKHAKDCPAKKMGAQPPIARVPRHEGRSFEVVTAPGGEYEAGTFAPSGPNVDITGLSATNCHWPLGNVADLPPYRFCGAPAAFDKPYCEYHAQLARSREQGRRRPAPKIDRTKRELYRITAEAAE